MAEAVEDIVGRHRKERKELQAKIQELKKNAPKNDKKKRKEAMEEVARMEADLDKRHATELKSAQENQQQIVKNSAGDGLTKALTELTTDDINVSKEAANDNNSEPAPSSPVAQRVSKAQKRRDKKAREARVREDEIKAAAEDAQFAPKAIEAQQMKEKLAERKLASHEINSDGDCLYNAIHHQLLQHGIGNHSVSKLRNETANYILANKDALIFYMTNPQTGELLDDDEFIKYCEAVRSTPSWGGQIELKALSSLLKVPVEVLQAVGPSTVQGAGEFPGPNLVITYHRHMYSLGEHYNSTMPLSDMPPAEQL